MSAYSDLQPKFDTFQSEVRKAKNAAGYTIEKLVDESGVPTDFVSSLSAGSAKKPSLFYTVCVCKVLGISIDRLFGLHEGGSDEQRVERIHELELELARKDGEIQRLEALNAIKDEGLRNRRTLVYAMCATLALLLCAVIGYVVFDIQLKNIGLFRSANVTVAAVFVVIIIIGAVALLIHALKTVYNDNHRRQGKK